jgi:serine/threonine-protein phosphatase PP1 catalytic subunit
LEVEKEFVIDLIISQLVKVKNEKWGNPVKLDQKAIKYLIDESIKIFQSEKMLLDLEAPIKIFGDVHG